MPIIARLTLSTTALLALGLLVAACASRTDPAVEADQPASSNGSLASPPPTPSAQPPTPGLADLGPAPDFTNEVWLNTGRPLNLASLRGQVILVEFWTYG